MSWLGDNFDFEAFNAKKLLKNVWEKPDQTLLGAQDPTGAAIWNGILGDDTYDANLNLLGGPSGTTWLDPGANPGKDTYSQAEAAGINTKPAEQTHDAAEAIAIMYLLNAGGSALGGGAAGGAEAGAAGGAGGGTAGGGLEGAMATYGNTGGGLLGDFSTAASSGNVAGVGQGAGSSLGGSGLGAGMGWTGSFGSEAATTTGGGWQDMAKKFMNQGQSQMQGQQEQAQKQSADRSAALQQQIMADLLRQEAQSRAESQAWNANQRGGGSWKV